MLTFPKQKQLMWIIVKSDLWFPQRPPENSWDPRMSVINVQTVTSQQHFVNLQLPLMFVVFPSLWVGLFAPWPHVSRSSFRKHRKALTHHRDQLIQIWRTSEQIRTSSLLATVSNVWGKHQLHSGSSCYRSSASPGHRQRGGQLLDRSATSWGRSQTYCI